MPNIFDGINKISDKDMLEQVVLLEAINIKNISKPMMQKVGKGFVKATNFLASLVGKESKIEEPQIKEIWDILDEKREELKDCSREELDQRMLDALILKSRNNQENQSLDIISVKVIEEASKLLDIPDDLTPAQKADSIYHRFSERLLENAQKKLKNQDDKSAKQTKEALQNTLENMSEEQKQEIRKALNIEDLTGETIRNALMKAGAPTAIMAIVSASGFGAFVALTTIIHAVFTTVLGITLPFVVYTSATSVLAMLTGPIGGILIFGLASYQIFNGGKKLDRELLAQVVWIAVSSYGKFTPNEEKLPSWIKNEEKEKVKIEEEKYYALIKETEEYKQMFDKCLNEISNLMQNQEKQKEEIENEKRRRKISEISLSNSIKTMKQLEIEKEEIKNSLKLFKQSMMNQENEKNNQILQEKSEIETLNKKLNEKDSQILQEKDKIKTLNKELNEKNSQILQEKSKIETLNKSIENALEDIEVKEKNIRYIEQEKEKSKIENEKLRIKLQQVESKLKQKNEVRRKEIHDMWIMRFDKFIIEPKAIRDVIKFSKKELICIERGLCELHDTKDPRSLSRGKIKGTTESYDHMGVNLPDGFPTRILYEVLSNQTKTVRIIEIYKHNKKKYQ